MISSGVVNYKSHSIIFQLYVHDVAIIINGRGALTISCPEDVIGFEWNLKIQPSCFERRVKIDKIADTVHIYRGDELMAILMKNHGKQKYSN